MPALQFLRLESPDGSADYSKMRLTNDSINLILLLREEFGISLNTSISPAVAENVVGDIPRTRRKLSELDDAAVTLARRMIEHQLLMAQAKGKS